MPELAYILRHPIQEARLAWLARSPRPPRYPVRAALRRERAIRRRERVAYAIAPNALDIPDEVRGDILGQEQNGYLVAPAARPGWWEAFKPWKVRHLRAAFESRRSGMVNMLDLEPGGSGSRASTTGASLGVTGMATPCTRADRFVAALRSGELA